MYEQSDVNEDSQRTSSRKALVLGGRTGMLGQALVKVLSESGYNVVPHGREDVDVLDFNALQDYMAEVDPDVVFNAVAYTEVDRAEDEKDKAQRLNVDLPAALARICGKIPFQLVHYSTDFVFDGRSTKPYTLSDEANPLSVYGKTKLAGENALLRAGLPGLLILRTSWLFGPGRKNFVKTILTLAKNREQLGVVHDQVGCPTYTMDLAKYSLALAEANGAHGLFHVVNSGESSWCELAAEAVNLAGLRCTVTAISTGEYPAKAVRPQYSVMSTDKFTHWTGITPRPWAQALRDYIFQYVELGE